MKKFLILVISASVLLTGCVLPNFSKHRPRHSSESAASSRRTKSSSSSSKPLFETIKKIIIVIQLPIKARKS